MTGFISAIPLPLRAMAGLAAAAGFVWIVASGMRDIGRYR